ncbi:MAG TPA: transcription elongation factor subunit Spt4 [Candidatus Thermoplasmatota archaeon]|nr:transcription elongation factor subunit Spt4 [Candidatus Thermoplasmatota archaeon]
MSKACKQCHMISEELQCANCGGATSKNWSGLLQIMDPATSELAKTMNIEKPGIYALKVR